MKFLKLSHWGFSVAAFLFFALSLVVPSGYSYGAALMLLTALLGAGVIRNATVQPGTWWLVGMLLAMGLLWGLSFDSAAPWSGSDQWPRYWLAAWALVVGASWGVSGVWVCVGLAAGAIGALGVASYQYLILGWDKAWGFTNAIQFGGLAMYMGMACWAMALFAPRSKLHAVLLWACGACGILASLLSETRGAWVVAPLLMVCILVVLWQQQRKRQAVGAVVAALVLVVAVMVPYGDKFEARGASAVAELQQYLQDPRGSAETSIGQRLEQWRVALHMTAQAPLTGWGTQGVVAGKQAMVDQGLAHPSIMAYGHAHNEVLDMLVKRGAIGLLALMLFYAIPLFAFWPTPRRLQQVPPALRPMTLGLRVAASLLPVAYFGFGWTQVFFAHNSGNMFYVFALVVFWSALQQLAGRTWQQHSQRDGQ